MRVCVCVCSGFPGGGHGERASLLPGVYLQSVALMQRNDYFYSRYFASLVALSGMVPHWPADYRSVDRHTWLLQTPPPFPSYHRIIRVSQGTHSPVRAHPRRRKAIADALISALGAPDLFFFFRQIIRSIDYK